MLASLTVVGCAGAGSSDYDFDDDALIEVSNLEQLNAIRWDLDGDGEVDNSDNAGAYESAFPDAADGMGCPGSVCLGYELARGLDFNNPASYASGAVNPTWTQGSGWLPLGGADSPFSAVFGGGGNAISNLFIDHPNRNDAGLFGGISGEAHSLGVVNVRIKAGSNVGGLVGFNFGAISESYVTGAVSGFRDSGGLVGTNRGSISRSYAQGEVSGKANVGGGLVSVNYGSIRGSNFAGKVSIGGARVAGGLAALNFGDISDSYAEAEVTGSDLVGGLVGLNQGPISGSYSSGVVSGPGDDIGGLTGVNYDHVSGSYSAAKVSGRHRIGGLIGINRSSGAISASYATGEVSGDIGAGGLAGWNDGTISSSYATGNMLGIDNSGGLVGRNNGVINVSYAMGEVHANHRVGGLVGNNDRHGTISASYSSGAVSGNDDSGGLVGENQGIISASYATGDVAGERDTGGLVGENLLDQGAGAIMSSYAAGDVSGIIRIGGLVGWNNGPISASYASGGVSGESVAGGLIGENENAHAINAAYWDTQATGQPDAVGYGPSGGAEGKTTSELQSPAGYTGIYAAWDQNGDFWDFEGPGRYPALKADFQRRRNANLPGIRQPVARLEGGGAGPEGRPASSTRGHHGRTYANLKLQQPHSMNNGRLPISFGSYMRESAKQRGNALCSRNCSRPCFTS